MHSILITYVHGFCVTWMMRVSFRSATENGTPSNTLHGVMRTQHILVDLNQCG